MKLIITGASGNVAVEVVRQALLSPSITSLVALARKPIEAPEGTPEASSSKLKSVVVKDYTAYSEEVKRELAGADGCIWTVAITPSKASALPIDEVRKVNYDSAIAGFKAILEANPKPKQPFRFLYMSGAAAYDPEGPAHSQAKAQWLPKAMDDQCLMRGQTWTQIVKIAEEDNTRADVCVVKPGLIAGAPRGIIRSAFSTVISLAGVVPSIDVTEVAAAMLHQIINGFEGTEGVMTNADMVKVGRAALQNSVKN